MTNGPPSGLAGLASGQHGVVTGAQLRDLGLSAAAARHLLDQGWLRRIRRGAYAVGGAPVSNWQRAVAAMLMAGPGTALSHSTAAAIHRIPHLVHRTDVIEITVEQTRHLQLSGVVIHSVNDPLGPDVQIVRGVAVTTPARTLADISYHLPPDLVARVVDEGCVTGLWTIEAVLRTLESRRTRGRRRPHALEVVLADRVLVPSGESLLESRVLDILKPFRPFEVHHPLVLDGRVVVLDVAWPRWRVAVESDGFAAHGRSRGNFDRDRRRSNLLAAHGWVVIHVTSVMSEQEIFSAVSRVLPLTR